MVELYDVKKTIKKQLILDEVSLCVHNGEICGIVGNNGSGKTVLFKCILGFYFIDSGKIVIDGHVRKKKDKILTDAAAIIENPAFLNYYTGYQNLQFLYELNHKKDKKRLSKIMQEVGLDPDSKKKVKDYSLGMKQRLSIAQAIMEDKKLIILDEPMNGLDKTGVLQMRKLFLELKKKNRTILISSHNEDDIHSLCDNVYEMDAGRIIRML